MTTQGIESQDYKTRLEVSRHKLLKVIEGSSDITFIRIHGNIGDHLIYAGARQLLSNIDYQEISILHLQPMNGHTAIISGGGGWCGTYHDLPSYLSLVEKRFKQVVVFPSTFDLTIDSVKQALVNSKATFFAREEVSYNQIREVCNADIALDTAFFFDYAPYRRNGKGILTAYREDPEAAGNPIPAFNNDISDTCESLDEFLWTIARHETIFTDRAHVMIAAALLGKYVEYRSSNYYKVPAIAEFSLKGFPVHRKETPLPIESSGNKYNVHLDIEKEIINESSSEIKKLRRTLLDIMALASPGDRFILVDEEQIRYALGKNSTAIPFLEKDGKYWGPPQDDETAIYEVNHMRITGAKFIVIAWPAFWWLDYYKEWHQYLRFNFTCVLENERLIIFDLNK